MASLFIDRNLFKCTSGWEMVQSRNTHRETFVSMDGDLHKKFFLMVAFRPANFID